MSFFDTSYVGEEVLHTQSAYPLSKSFNLDLKNSTKDLSSAIAAARAREESFYAMFNESSFEGFIRLIKNNFLSNENDRMVLANFQFDNLSKTLYACFQQNKREYIVPEKYTVKVTIKGDKKIDVKKLLKDFDVSGDGDLSFNLALDDERLFALINKATGSTRRKDVVSTHRASSGRIKDVKGLEKEMASDLNWLQFNITNNATNQQEKLSSLLEHNTKERRFPWGYKKEDILAAQSDPELSTRLNEAYREVKRYVIDILGSGASPELRRALEITWMKKLGNSLSEDFTFFERGMAGDSLKGALGEFQAAAIMEMFNIKFHNNNISNTAAKILGDTSSKGGLADVGVFNNFGIQVKNFSMNRTNQMIDSTISAGDFSKYIEAQSMAKDFRIFLANYFFNSDFQTRREAEYSSLSEEISKLQYALMSLSVAEEDQGVSFYLISGKFLVPASRILTAFQQDSALFSSSGQPVYGKVIAKSDKEYEEGDLFKKYWENHVETSSFSPTPYNAEAYKNLVYSNIHIKSSFNYQKIIGDFSNSLYAMY